MTTENQCHIIVLGNEKGGSGKSTTAIHLSIGLLQVGLKVATIDLDSRQGTLSRYVENRGRFAELKGVALPMPTHRFVLPSDSKNVEEAITEEEAALKACIDELKGGHDVIVIDSPGSASNLSHVGHSYANTLITPLNDSFIDLDVLARIEDGSLKIEKPSHYAAMVFKEKMKRAQRDKETMDWIVLRNRLSSLNARNKEDMGTALAGLAGRIGFRLVSGFGERVIYRELFLKGLTLMDLHMIAKGEDFNVSHVAARQEVRSLIQALKLPILATKS